MKLHEDADVTAVHQGRLQLGHRESAAFDECLWATQAAAPNWLAQTGLQLGESPSPAAECMRP